MAFLECLATIESGGGGTFEWKELWNNPNPTTAMNQNTVIPINLTEYDYVLLVVKSSTSADGKPRGNSLLKVFKDGESLVYESIGATAAASTKLMRKAYAANDGVHVYYGFSGANDSNSSAIPLYVIGIKTDITDLNKYLL